MKKKWAKFSILAGLIVILLLSGLYINHRHNKRIDAIELASVEAVVVSHDKSVYPSFIYNASAINSENVCGEKEHKITTSAIGDIKEMTECSTNIVRGQITGLCYTFINGIAYTVADVHISQSLKGSLLPDDVISLYYLGGYADVQDYNNFYDINGGEQNKFYKFTVPDYPVPQVGQDMLFFLSPSYKELDIPEDTFYLTAGANSIYSPSESGETFTGNGKSFTCKYLKELIK